MTDNVFQEYGYSNSQGRAMVTPEAEMVPMSMAFPEFHNRVRIDGNTGMLSVLDIIKVATCQEDSGNVSREWRNVKDNHPELSNRVETIRINNKVSHPIF